MIARGDTTGVFQLESSGFREILKKLKPDCLEDIVAAVALYRPGPLEGGMVDDFIDRKHGKKKVEYPHPWLEPVLADTYGVIVYQEQVMQIAQVLGGYSLGGADLLRRAMGKKKPEEMAKQKQIFLDGARSQADRSPDRRPGVRADGVLRRLRVQPLALGGVRLDHVPDRVPQAPLPARVHGRPDVVRRRQRRQHRQVHRRGPRDGPGGRAPRHQRVAVRTSRSRPPRSPPAWPAPRLAGAGGVASAGGVAKVIRFGLGAVKGVGGNAVEAILEARVARGPVHVAVRAVPPGRHPEVQPARAGAADQVRRAGRATVGGRARGGRAQLLAALDSALERGASEQRDRRSGQTSLFGLLAATEPARAPGARRRPAMGETYPDVEPWGPKQLLAFEKEALGFYISGHPLDRYRGDLQRFASATTSDFLSGRRGVGEQSIGGIVSQYREMITKKGDKMARFMLEDAEGAFEVIAFPKTFEKVRHVLVSDEPILCTGQVKNEGNAEAPEWKMLLESCVPLSELRQQKTSRVDIHLNADQLTHDQIDELKTILANATRGDCQAVLRLKIPQRSETVVNAARRLGGGADRGPPDPDRAPVRRPGDDAGLRRWPRSQA